MRVQCAGRKGEMKDGKDEYKETRITDVIKLIRLKVISPKGEMKQELKDNRTKYKKE